MVLGLTGIRFLVIVPAIAQRIVDDTNLPVYSADILDPKPDSITFILHTSLTLPAGIEAQTDPFSLSLFDRNVKPMQPYLKVPMDGYDLSGTTNISVTRKDEEILSEQQFVNVLSHAVNQRKFTLSAKGKTTGYLGELKAPLTLDKNIKLDG